MHRSDNRKLHFGFLMITLLMIAIGLYAYRLPDQQTQQGDLVTRTHEVLFQLATLSNHLTDAETGQRDFLLTGQAVYLQSFSLAAQQIDRDIARFQQLTQENPWQKSRIPLLRKHIDARLADLKETINLRKSRNANAALKGVSSGWGREKMEVIQLQIDQMQAEEQRSSTQYTAKWHAVRAQTRAIFIGSGTLLYVLLVIVYSVLFKHAVHRQGMFDVERQSGAGHRVESERLAKVVSIQRDLACVRQSLQATMQSITDRTREITHADGGTVALLEGGELVTYAASGTAAPFSRMRIEIARSLSGRCVQENAVIRCYDTEMYDGIDMAVVRNVGVRSAVAVPLRHNGQVIGAFTVRWSMPNAFTEEDVVTLELIAGALSAALSDAVGKDVLQTSEERLDEAQRTAHIGSGELNIATQKITMSKELARMLDHAPGSGELDFAAFHARFAPEDVARLDGYIQRAVRDGIGYEIDLRRTFSEGETPRWYHAIGKPLLNAQGSVIRLAGTYMDITERKQAEDQLRESEARMRAVLENAPDAIISMDEHGVVERFNAAAESIFGYSAEEAVGRNIKMLMPNPYHDALDTYLSNYQETGDKKVIGIGREVMAQRKDGTTFPADLAVGEVRFGNERRFTGFIRDITERKRIANALESQQVVMQEMNGRLIASLIRLEELATRDGLTGLTNHPVFYERLKEEYDRSVRYNSLLSVVILDVDRFKDYNDTYGHQVGDAILKQVGEILQREGRSTDTVARYGGEEFVLILPETGAEEARKLAERMRQAIASASWEHTGVTASFGVATLSALVPNAAALVSEADIAMYRSKHNGRNCVTHFMDALENDSLDIRTLESVNARLFI